MPYFIIIISYIYHKTYPDSDSLQNTEFFTTERHRGKWGKAELGAKRNIGIFYEF